MRFVLRVHEIFFGVKLRYTKQWLIVALQS